MRNAKKRLFLLVIAVAGFALVSLARTGSAQSSSTDTSKNNSGDTGSGGGGCCS